ncbi:uncharacterized protein EDB93DRAFT_1246930 [Suillus bovinus]|uniref:uncharacterized protein n=1 Tax=Suillus bovinus TaxID=48563 RepID=UPI001B87AC79|nr:uncharacterized protein EDB93DRAFT_1246930 [Suillus bovinus]KAG2156738.1 hypothetical protein EDB93DRAFT_1246930 [Suillus bovinus]
MIPIFLSYQNREKWHYSRPSAFGRLVFLRIDPQHCKSVQQAVKTSVANKIVQIGIATIIVLEYSAFLANSSKGWEYIKSAVDYYLKSPTAVAVEKGAEEISRQNYNKEELEKKVFEFILENRLSKDLTEKK